MAHAAHAPRVGASDDFFQIGGHSLSAAQLVARLREQLHIDVAISDVFFNPSVSALAARIEVLRQAQLTEPAFEEEPLVRLPRRHELR
jgi:acyl carrier protein